MDQVDGSVGRQDGGALVRVLLHFVFDERAAALVDYALITSLFAIVCVASLNLLRTQTGTNLNRTSNNLTNMGYTP